MNETPDYLANHDHSTPKDYSNPTSRSLANAEKGEGSNTDGGGSASRDIATHENDVQKSPWLANLETKRKAARGKNQSKTGFLAKTKNKVALAIIVAIIGAFAAFAPSLLGLLGINQFYEMIQQKFGANMEVVVSKRINKQFYKQIQDSSRTPTRGGVCGARMRVACRYKGMSERAIRNFERRTGAKVNYEDSHIPGRMKIGSIEFDGKTLTPDRTKWGRFIMSHECRFIYYHELLRR